VWREYLNDRRPSPDGIDEASGAREVR